MGLKGGKSHRHPVIFCQQLPELFTPLTASIQLLSLKSVEQLRWITKYRLNLKTCEARRPLPPAAADAEHNPNHLRPARSHGRQAMKDESTLIHCEHVSERSFHEVVTAFEKAVGEITGDAFQKLLAASSGAHDFETRVRSFEGASGFMRFLDIDHGVWLSHVGLPARCKLYILGNPLIARTMLEHDLGVGLNVPVRIMIYEDSATGKTRLAYDLPSSLMARLHNQKVTAAARRLDEKLAALARAVTGVEA